jgi:hypothetical protein
MSLLKRSLLLIALVLAPTTVAQPPGEVVIYSGRSEPLIVPVIQLFQQQTGIKVTLQSGTATALANLVLQEQPNPRADLFIANDAGTLEFLKLKGALQPYSSEQIKKIPEQFRARDGSWLGVSGRSRVIMYNTKLVKPEELPNSVFALTDPRWKNKIAMATTRNESVIAWVTALRLTKGDAFTKEYLLKLKANGIVTLNGHTDVRKAVGRGEFPLGLVNHYYYHLELRDGSPVGVVYPRSRPRRHWGLGERRRSGDHQEREAPQRSSALLRLSRLSPGAEALCRAELRVPAPAGGAHGAGGQAARRDQADARALGRAGQGAGTDPQAVRRGRARVK